jgi:hypothetical protein
MMMKMKFAANIQTKIFNIVALQWKIICHVCFKNSSEYEDKEIAKTFTHLLNIFLNKKTKTCDLCCKTEVKNTCEEVLTSQANKYPEYFNPRMCG